MFKKDLKILEDVLKKDNPISLNCLEEPLEKNIRDSLFEKLNIPDMDLYELFSWKNGCNTIDIDKALFEFDTTLCKLENVLDYKKDCPIQYITMDSLLLLFDGPEDALLFNYAKGKEYGRIHLYSVSLLSIDKPVPYYDSLSSMIQTTIELYKNKKLYYDNKLNFLVSDGDSIDIYNKFNPICRYYEE